MAFVSGFGPVVKSQTSAKCSRKAVVISMSGDGGGKGFGGGEATRDPEPTEIDPNDPKGKQKAIHKASSFEDYMRKRKEEAEQGK